MKPKRRIWCPACKRSKMLFETERKAKDFIKWNGGDIETGGNELRTYYCQSCCGWHITKRQHWTDYKNSHDKN